MSKKIETLSQASDKQQFIRRFAEVQANLYRASNRPIPPAHYWVHLLSVFDSVPKELFIYVEDGEDKGRISINLTEHKEDLAFFGMVEYPLDRKDILKDLIHDALGSDLLTICQEIIGPVDINVWFGNRFKFKGSTEEFSWESANPVEYTEDFINLGFSWDQKYFSYFYKNSDTSIERTRPAFEKALTEGYSFRNIDLSLKDEVDKLYHLNILGFKVNYLYEPISRDQYANTHIAFLKDIDLKYSFFLLDPNKKEIGYVYSFIKDSYFVIKSIVMDPTFQGAKLSSSLIHRTLIASREDQNLKTIGAMVRKGNVSEHFFNFLGTPEKIHLYTMLKKSI